MRPAAEPWKGRAKRKTVRPKTVEKARQTREARSLLAAVRHDGEPLLTAAARVLVTLDDLRAGGES